MATPSKPPRRKGKGAPPTLAESATANTNTVAPENTDDRKLVNFRWPPELHKRLKIYCLEHDMDMQDFAAAAVINELDRKGG
ncbi:hypothetical protein F0A16_20505 [Salinicola corii]|uniref:Toxin-antitoxin system HicB family antitoxin n=1 Tax=Salinicola corii TaxID=2606937 RepID=A0A640WA96_9GAMM|nr:hypothetical protein [Salinicola corii]KAA0015473.1 hypothetical protein F0A16_20505 [Salinicola corii]